LAMPPLETVLSAEATFCDSLTTEEANANANTI
jgi:hypothetical protein